VFDFLLFKNIFIILLNSYNFLLITFLFVLSISCKKDEISSNNSTTTDSTDYTRAGIYDSNYIHTAFSPAFKINITWDSLNLYGYGQDSIDLNSDGVYDLIFKLSLLNYDSIHLLNGGMPNPFPYCDLKTKNGFEIAMYTESYPIGLGQYGSKDFVDTLSYNKLINTISNWKSGENSDLVIWGENPGTTGCPSFGGWHYVQDIKYIGLRKDGNKYGWIEADFTDTYNPLFISFALKK